MPARSLVKKVLKSGTGLTMQAVIAGKGRKTDENNNKANKPISKSKTADFSHLKLGLKVRFHYAGYFEYEGAPFDSTQARGECWNEVLGINKMIPALEYRPMT